MSKKQCFSFQPIFISHHLWRIRIGYIVPHSVVLRAGLVAPMPLRLLVALQAVAVCSSP
jgi:hypothetical protein